MIRFVVGLGLWSTLLAGAWLLVGHTLRGPRRSGEQTSPTDPPLKVG